MKEIRLRHCNGVDLNRVFSANLKGGVRGFDDAMAIETYSNICAPTLRTITGFIVINQIIEINMINRDFHKRVRVVYRAMRKQYGIEKVQDECLRVFKVIYPLYYKAQKGEEYDFDEKTHERLGKIFYSWNVREGSQLDDLLFTIRDRMINDEFTKESFVKFCDDILPVVMRIRKLTPRECGRLMGCDEKTLDTMLSCGISKSALYKCFGNSIVVDVLFHIFRKLFVEPEQDIVKGEAVQLSLF